MTKIGEKVRYWPEPKPGKAFLGNESYPATVVALGEERTVNGVLTPVPREDKAIRLSVQHPRTGRTFFAWAKPAPTEQVGKETVTVAASGCYTAAPSAEPAVTAPAPKSKAHPPVTVKTE